MIGQDCQSDLLRACGEAIEGIGRFRAELEKHNRDLVGGMLRILGWLYGGLRMIESMIVTMGEDGDGNSTGKS